MRKFLTLLVVLMLGIFAANAQSRTITGRVVDSTGKGVAGASVQIRGKNTGVAAGSDGLFSIQVNKGDVLMISSVSFKTNEITIDEQSDLMVTLSANTANIIPEVIVTALGLTRTRNQVPYAAQVVTGDEVSKNRNNNFVSNLSGKVSGLEIRQNNSLGASTNVILRGVKSLTGNNQALFVVDGVPYNNANTNVVAGARTGQSQGGGGYDYGSAAADINPDDIESVTVLKGAAASALYGSIGGNGVIVITTKKGRRGLGVTVNSGVSFGSIDKTTFPEYQNKYGGGYGKYYGPDQDAYLNQYDINGDGVLDYVVPTTEDASYGQPFDPSLQVYQWDAFDSTSPYYGKSRPWLAAQNGPSSFFEHPVSTNNSVIVSGGGDRGSFKLGYTRTDDKGLLPNSNITKNLADFSSTYNITNRLTAGAAINFSNIEGKGRYGTGYDGASGRNVMTNFREWWEVNVDVQELKEAYNRSGGRNITWNWSDPIGGDLSPIYWDNPYFVRYQNYESDTRNRYFGNVNLNYKVTDWLNVLGRISVDNYSELQQERKAVGSVGVPYYSRYNHSWNETNYDLLINLNKDISEDFNLKALIGTNIRKQHDQSVFGITNGGLIVSGIYSLANSVNTPNAPVEYDGSREVDGIFAGATLSWKNMVTIDGTLRRDASSTLPKGNNRYYYPSASLGFVFSELLKNQTWLSYGKIRGNYAQVGGDAPIYSVFDTYLIGYTFGSNAQASVANVKNNPDLKPERTRSTEVGLEMSFLKNRFGFDVTYYKARTIDEIVPVTLSTATGYTSQFLNSGTVQNQGIEVSLNLTPVRTQNFSWTINANWTRNRNKVIALFKDATGQEAQNLQIGSFQGGITFNATLNQSYGTIRGTDFIYDSATGQKVVGTNGRYLKTSTSNVTIGNVNPDWIGGINNTFRYKGISLSFLIDVRHGGDVFSTDMYYGLATGLYPETAGNNDLGNPLRGTIDEGGGIIRPGVDETGKTNTVRAQAYNYGAYGYRYSPDKAFVYDASYVKLREAVINYSLPVGVIKNLKYFKGIDISVIGRNLWIIHKNLPYSDPEEGLSSGNIQGYQVGAYPTVRTFAFNLKLTF